MSQAEQTSELLHTHQAELSRRLKQVAELSDEVERQAASIMSLRYVGRAC